VEFRLLGPVEFATDGTARRLGRLQERCVLAVLLVELGHAVPVTRLVDLLWDRSPPAQATAIVQTHVSRLRALFRDAGAERYGVRLATTGAGYMIEAPDQVVDMHRFRRLVQETRRADSASARVSMLRDALDLWRGPALADAATAPIKAQICAGLDEQRVSAQEDYAELRLGLGRHRELVTELTTLVAQHPLRERLVALLMLAQYRSGQQAEALASFRSARRRLIDELGIEPGAELRAVEQAILAHDPGLEPRLSAMNAVEQPSVETSTTVQRPAWRGPRSRLTHLIGREPEVAGLTQLMSDHRLITVVGAAGVGKTTLALHCAESAAPELRSDVTVVLLGSLRSWDELVLALGGLLGVKAATVDESLSGVHAVLGGRPHLLLLDNCEHLTQPCARLLRRLLSASAMLRVLATSRQPLGVDEETVYRLEPLRLPDVDRPADADVPAVALFLRRAREITPQVAPTDDDLAAVGRICRRVDGLPLALELAAARLRTRSVTRLADDVEHGFDLLDVETDWTGTTLHPLSATLDWSYQLLSPAEQKLLARLSVFRGGFTTHAAEQVCGDADAPDSVLPALSRLVDHCLVQVHDTNGRRRHRLLEVVQDYAAGKLDDASAMAEAHLEYWLDRARSVLARQGFDDQVRSWTEMEDDLGNLRAAVEYAYRTGRAASAVELTSLLFNVWTAQGNQFAEPQLWYDRAVPYLDECPSGPRSGAQFHRALLCLNRNDHVGCLALLRPAMPDLLDYDPDAHLEARIIEARVMSWMLDPDALTRAAQVFADASAADDLHYQLHGATMLAEVLITWGRYEDAAQVCTRFDAAGSPGEPANADLTRLAAVHCLAELARADLAGAAEAKSRLLDRLGYPHNYIHHALPRMATALYSLATTPPELACTAIAGAVTDLSARYPQTVSCAYWLQLLLAEAARRAGRPREALDHLIDGLEQSVDRSDYSKSLPGVLTAGWLATELGEHAAGQNLVGEWDLLRRRLGLPAPLGYAEAVRAAGLDPNAPAEPSAPWDGRQLEALVNTAYHAMLRLAH